MKRIRIILLLAICVSAVLGHALGREEAVDESLYLEEVAPETLFSEKGGVPPHYPSGPSGKGTAAFNTYDIAPSIRGYAGPIKVLVALGPDGTVTGIRVLEHKETQNYVHRMDKPEFLGQFLGKHVNEPLEIDNDIDGISRATVSVKALADSVRVSSREAASAVFGIKVAGQAAGGAYDAGWIAYIVFFSLALGMYFFTRDPKRSRSCQRARDAMLVLNVVVLGIWLSTPFSVLHLYNLLLLRLSSDVLWYLVLASIALSILLAGRFYCGWLCPFGAIAEFLGRMPLKKWDIYTGTDDRWRNMKYIVLGFVSLVVLLSGRAGFGAFETYLTLFSFSGTAFAWALLVVSLLANLRVKRFWCRYLCPVAAITGMLSRSDPAYISAGDCPMSNKHMPLISECIRCNRCYQRKS
jgi:Na+-translocating ferredoxin:NAD+ oxidoreductase RnfG subunit